MNGIKHRLLKDLHGRIIEPLEKVLDPKLGTLFLCRVKDDNHSWLETFSPQFICHCDLCERNTQE